VKDDICETLCNRARFGIKIAAKKIEIVLE